MNNNKGFLEKFYKLSENGTDIKTEIIAGVTTFLAMSYVLLVLPRLLAQAGMPESGLFTSVAIIAIFGSCMHAFYSKLPLATSPGLGLTAFFATTVVGRMGYTWQQGLAVVTISGALFFIIAVTPLRKIVVDSLPETIKIAITGGIGLFIALIGLRNAGLVINTEAGMYFGHLADKSVLLAVFGLLLTLVLMARGVKASLIISIVTTTIVGIPLGITDLTKFGGFTLPPSIAPTFLQQDFAGLLGDGGLGAGFINILMVILTISLVDFFDNIGTLMAIADKGNLYDENGDVKNMRKALISDSISTTLAGFIGTTTTSTYLECTAGIASGGKTGLSALTTAGLFGVALFLHGIISIVPGVATAPALIVIGVLMIGSVTRINFDDITEGAPAFFTIVMMPFTSSIAEGIATGIISYVVLKTGTGKIKEIKPAMWVLALLFIIRFAIM